MFPKRKTLMNIKLLVIIQIIGTFILSIPVYAAIQTITHTIKQPFGGSQSPDDARTAGISRAKREALEQFGTYIESTTIVKSSQVDSDEILALTAGVTKAEVIKQKNYTNGDAFGIEITVNVELDTAMLEKSLKRLLEDRNHLKDLKSAREREKKLLDRITELEKQDDQKGKSKKQTEKLKKDFKAVSQQLTAVEWFDRAAALSEGIKYSEPEKAIEYLTQAIQLEPNFTEAYHIRGYIYIWSLNQYARAIADYDQALRLEPNDAKLYSFRGQAYLCLKQYYRAIEDFTQAIRLEPHYATYIYRGGAYVELNQLIRAIEDFDQAIRLNPEDMLAYYNRGIAYRDLDQHDRAIESFDQAIRINTNFASAYDSRGQAYWRLDNTQRGCADFEKACSLGSCSNYELVQQKGLCR